MKIYRVKDWNKQFENNRSRTVQTLAWVAVPNRHDGEGFALVMENPRAAEIYTAWMLILQVASRCQPRGSLVRDDGTALDAGALARKTRGQVAWFELALPFLTNGPGWLEVVEADDNAVGCQSGVSRVSAPCQADDVSLPRTEGKGTEGKGVGGTDRFAVGPINGSVTRAPTPTPAWPTLAEALAWAQGQGGQLPVECVRKWWLEHDARGGRDRTGASLQRWESSLQAFAVAWNEVKTPDGGKTLPTGPARAIHAPTLNLTTEQMKQALEELEKVDLEMSVLRDRTPAEDRAKWSQLKGRRQELAAKLKLGR